MQNIHFQLQAKSEVLGVDLYFLMMDRYSFLMMLCFVCLLVLTSLLFISAVIQEPNANGSQDTSQYEHPSIPATVNKLLSLFGCRCCTATALYKDAWAGTFANYFKIRKTSRPNFPILFLLFICCSVVLLWKLPMCSAPTLARITADEFRERDWFEIGSKEEE